MADTRIKDLPVAAPALLTDFLAIDAAVGGTRKMPVSDLATLLRPGTDFVWRPGGTTGGNVYATFAELVVAVAATRGARRIFIDTSLATADIAAPGDFIGAQGPVEWCGARSSSGSAVTLHDGAAVKGVSTFTDIILASDAATPVFVDSLAVPMEYVFRGYTLVSADGTAALFTPVHVAGRKVVRITLRDNAFFFGGIPIFEMADALDEPRILVHDTATLDGAAVKTRTGGSRILRFGGHTTVNPTQSTAGAGSWTLYDFDALTTSYDAGLVPIGITASSVQGAIDYLKQQVWRASDFVNVDAGAGFLGAANTAGVKLRVNRLRTATGALIAWNCAAPTLVTVNLRDAGGTVRATGSTTISAPGIYQIDFVTPLNLAAYLGTDMTLSVFDGADTWSAPIGASHPARPMALDAAVTLVGYVADAGNVNPTTPDLVNAYGVDLITTGAS